MSDTCHLHLVEPLDIVEYELQVERIDIHNCYLVLLGPQMCIQFKISLLYCVLCYSVRYTDHIGQEETA